uniref:NADH dehydrogenase subunit 2 n=1 Tax=Mantispa japonica TaxID=2448033 RepID=UPI000EF354C0|nr:NADH dehydrogenase subunit 2 [Mantispa japonica]AYG51245.1 NADH dehydrogenase subunit 2 [Mantispa japonica]
MFNNLLFITMLMLGTFISICSNSWFGAWMGLEINLLSFIPLLNNSLNSLSTESSLKYFIIQALASSILLFSIIMMSMFELFSYLNMNFMLNLVLNASILIKMGAAPFHFWFPEMMEGLSWWMSFILMTWQKIAPMLLISYCLNENFILLIMVISILIGSIGGLNQTSLRKIMAYSSINHIGWMLSSLLISNMYWYIYFSIYSFISLSIISYFNFYNIFYINQNFITMNLNPLNKFVIFCSFLSLGGLPPFLGFLPKWMIIQNFSSNYPMLTLMVILTLITLYYYIRITYSAFMINYTNQKMILFNNFNLNLNCLMMNFMSIFGLILIMFLYYLF